MFCSECSHFEPESAHPTERCLLGGGAELRQSMAAAGAFAKPRKPSDPTKMKSKAVFYHAGCPVCLDAEKQVTSALDRSRFELEIVHLGSAKTRVAEAERAGVKSVPALLLGGVPLHLNFGAPLSALK